MQRHRLFESNVPLTAPGACRHQLPALRVFGHGRPGNSDLTGPGYARASRDAMGIWWMTRDQLNEAVPAVYAERAGLQIMTVLTGGRGPRELPGPFPETNQEKNEKWRPR